jgi:hypothetical protein
LNVTFIPSRMLGTDGEEIQPQPVVPIREATRKEFLACWGHDDNKKRPWAYYYEFITD